jgi:hypothetical protein
MSFALSPFTAAMLILIRRKELLYPKLQLLSEKLLSTD